MSQLTRLDGRVSALRVHGSSPLRLLVVCFTALAAHIASPATGQELEAQVNGLVQAHVAAASVYDDNVYLTEQPTSDFIWRVSPAVSMQHKSPRVTFLSRYTFDAERFAAQHALTSALARQTALIDATTRLNPTTTVTMNAGYLSTETAADLNAATTGVTGARLPASRWHSGGQLSHSMGPRSTSAAAYSFAQDWYSSGDIASHSAEFRFIRRIATQQRWHLVGKSEWFQFHHGQPISSQVAALGWADELTSALTVNLEGGTRYTSGSVRPELSASIRHRSRNREMSASYALTQETALGVDGILDVQRVQAELSHRPKRSFQAQVRAAIFVNRTADHSTADRRSRIYSFSGVLARPINRTLAVEIGYTRDVQRPRLDRPGLLVAPLQRNTASARFVVSS